MKITEILTEGPLDYIKGATKHIGGKIRSKLEQKGREILDPIYQAHAAGKQASQIADTKAKAAQAQAAIPQLIKAIGANVVKIQRLEKELGKLPTNEGLWDYLRGASSATGAAAKQVGSQFQTGIGQVGSAIKGAASDIGNSVSQNIQSIHTTGQRASIQSEINKRRAKLPQLAQQLYIAARIIGKTDQDIRNLINQTFGNPENKGQPTKFSAAIIKVYNDYLLSVNKQPIVPTKSSTSPKPTITANDMTLAPGGNSTERR